MHLLILLSRKSVPLFGSSPQNQPKKCDPTLNVARIHRQQMGIQADFSDTSMTQLMLLVLIGKGCGHSSHTLLHGC